MVQSLSVFFQMEQQVEELLDARASDEVFV